MKLNPLIFIFFLQVLLFSWGCGETGQLVDMHKFGIWEPIAVKMQTIKTAIEVKIDFDFLFDFIGIFSISI